jgi:rsbT co-antagonist protein RsbR
MPHPSEFDLPEMIALGAALRSMGSGAAHMEEAADRIVSRLVHAFAPDVGAASTLSLCRFYVTARYSDLDDGLRAFAAAQMEGQLPSPDSRCLTLLATKGVLPEWSSRHRSVAHKAIPLTHPDFSKRFPMFMALFKGFGLSSLDVLDADPAVVGGLRHFGVSLVENAQGNPDIPSQAEFVEPFGIQSVLAFGGLLPNVRGRGNNHEVFIVILFSKVRIPPEMADLILPVALNVKLAILRFCGGRVFAPKGEPEPPSTGPANDLAQQRARAMALEQLLEVHEGVVAGQAKRLQAAVAKATHRAAELRRSEGAMRKQAEILENVLRSMHDSIAVSDENGRLILLNPGAKRIFSAGPPRVAGTGPDTTAATARTLLRERGIYLPDGITLHPVESLPMIRALRGETVDQAELYVKNPSYPTGAAFSVTANPIRRPNGQISGVVAVFRDVTEGRQLAQKLEERHHQLEQSERTQTELVERLRIAVEDLSTPILEVWDDVLALPIIGVVDARRAGQVTDRLLDEIVRKKPRYVIIDLTGVKLIDSDTAEHFVRLIRAVELVGTQCVLTGIQPGVSKTIVAQGLDLGPVPTRRNLKHALKASARRVSGGLGGEASSQDAAPSDDGAEEASADAGGDEEDDLLALVAEADEEGTAESTGERR